LWGRSVSDEEVRGNRPRVGAGDDVESKRSPEHGASALAEELHDCGSVDLGAGAPGKETGKSARCAREHDALGKWATGWAGGTGDGSGDGGVGKGKDGPHGADLACDHAVGAL
jgi:hypothetical protein